MKEEYRRGEDGKGTKSKNEKDDFFDISDGLYANSWLYIYQ